MVILLIIWRVGKMIRLNSVGDIMLGQKKIREKIELKEMGFVFLHNLCMF